MADELKDRPNKAVIKSSAFFIEKELKCKTVVRRWDGFLGLPRSYQHPPFIGKLNEVI